MFLLVALGLTSGCGPDRSAVVPERAAPPVRAPAQPTTSESSETAVDTEPPLAPFTAIEGTRLPAGTTTTTVDGARVGFGGFEVRAHATTDADHDGDGDLVIALVSPRELAVGFARRDGERFTQSILARSPRPPECVIGDAIVRVIAADLGVVEQRLLCEGAPGLEITPVTLGDVARAPERASVRMPVADPFVRALTVIPQPIDPDHDGVTDLGLVVTVGARASARTETETLVVRNLASGMAPDLAGLGARIGTLERSARRDVESSPARAVRDAGRAAAFAFLVCPETGNPAIRFVGSASSGCGLAQQPAHALASWAAALARTRHLDDAAAILFALEPRGLVLDAASERLVAHALGTSPERTAPAWVTYLVPELANANTIAFDPDGALLVRASADTRMRLGPSPTFAAIGPGDPSNARLDAARRPRPTIADATVRASTLRFGDTVVYMHEGKGRLLALPALDGGAVGAFAIDDAHRFAACIVDGFVRAAVLTP